MIQLALAWLMKPGDDLVPIHGTKQGRYPEQNWASLEVCLSDDEEREVRGFADGVEGRSRSGLRGVCIGIRWRSKGSK